MAATSFRERRERRPGLSPLPMIDFVLTLLVLGTASLTAQMLQQAVLDAAVDRELSSQRSFWGDRASELCVPPPQEPPLVPSHGVLDLAGGLEALRHFRDGTWVSYRDCMEERVEVIPEELLRFSFNRSDAFDMPPEAVEQAKNKIVALVDSHRDRRLILVRGHTDRKGTDEYNYALSADRAWYVGRIVLAHLSAQGLVPGRDVELIPEGLGKSRPVDRRPDESDEAFDSRCRRIELAFQRIRGGTSRP